MHRLATFAGLVCFAAPVLAQEITPTAPDQANSQTDAETATDDIVITASRRAGTVRDVPTAVSAYSGDRLKEQQLTSLSDLAATSPNIQIGSYQTNSNVAIRGIGNTQTNAGSDAGVAIHADGVYLGQSALATSTLLDLERVEILRGPQGTLFGRNATGGAINLIPNRPTTGFEASLETSLGLDPSQVRTAGFVSGPLSSDGSLRGRFAAQQDYNRGYTRNFGPEGPRRLDNREIYSGRGQVEWEPSDSFQVRGSVEYQRGDDNGPAQFNLGTADLSGLQPPQLQGQALGSRKDREVGANEGERSIEATTALITADLTVGRGNLRALYSYNDTNQFTNADTDGTAIFFARSQFLQKSDQHFAELLYTSDAASPFSVVLGVNYFDEDISQDVSVPISTLPIPVDLGGDVTTRSYAAFGQAQYRFTTGTKLFAGLRYSDDRKSIDEYNVFIGTASQKRSSSRITYEVGVSQDFGRLVTGYAKYATGYKSGGFSAGSLSPAFNPETNANLEIGLKGTYLDGALSANLALFRMKYDDLQVNQVVGVVAAVTNAAKATIDGAEAEIVIRPTNDLRVELAAAWLDATFDRFVTVDSARPSLGTLDLSGNRLPQSPSFSGSAGLYQDIAVDGGKVTVGGRLDYKSRVFFSEFNIPVSSQKPVAKLDLNLRYQSDDRKWFGGIYALNVTDRPIVSTVLVVSSLLGSIALGSLQPGRQIGVNIGRRF